MAYKPSLRQKSQPLDMELDIRPVMNLMVVLIPLLIASAEWVKIGSIEINVPPSKDVGASGANENQNQIVENELKLGLKVAITSEGFTIGNSQTLLSNEEGVGPTVPLKSDASYDYDVLKQKLVEIKKAINGKGFKDADRAVLTASPGIEYQVIISVMDNLQTYTDDTGEQQLLFPQVNFGSIIQ